MRARIKLTARPYNHKSSYIVLLQPREIRAMDTDTAAQRLAALGNTTRLSLFRLLVRAGTEGMNIGDIQHHLGVPASTLAHHLRALAEAGVVEQQKRGREVITSANYEAMNGLVAYLTEQCCDGLAEVKASA